MTIKPLIWGGALGVLTSTLPVLAETQFNGDMIQGKPVITRLDVDSLEPGKQHEFYFRVAGQNNAGQHYYLPVSVLKGEAPGKKVMLVAGVHANEMNPYLTVHKVKERLAVEALKGTVTIVHQFNIPGLIANVREFVPSGPVKVNENLNRQANTEDTRTSGQRYSHSIWNDLLKHNADYAIDMHTANPTTFPLFAYTDYSIPAVKEMTRLFGVDVAFSSQSQTTVDGAYNGIGVPAFTLEIGARDVYEPELVERAVDGTLNFLRHIQLIEGEVMQPELPVETEHWEDVRAEFGGFVVPKVQLLDKVKKGDLMFVQYDAFGHEVKQYHSPADGVVVQIIQNPMAESGSQLGSVVY
ncbi:succinylglutamate desuccinylase/aspartoacylase family protein [Zobellella denitrificans]